MRWIATIVLMAAYGCGKCAESDLDGTYTMSFSERSGDCGPQTETVIIYKDGKSVGEGGSGCVEAYDRMSDENCTNESKGTCEDAANDLRFSITMTMTEDDKDGEKYKGVAELAVSQLSTGAYVCLSTYDVAARRR